MTIATPIIAASGNKDTSNAGAKTAYATSPPKYNVSHAIENVNRFGRVQNSLKFSREGSSEVMVLPAVPGGWLNPVKYGVVIC
ncbi:hypothetical protein K227x_14230 [Rubripirellula lacrimiformis]|uniref:Uncharacterized protein n=1 Tax=Rubripirellula lacrimiformis TaxID=1930273 RepID=A0A517N7C8_9BACT|nr:hypothetical protein K227x_14230 [Rubripirellula lacrimiformis]